MRFYGYKKCSTCRKAIKWLDDREIKYAFIDITTSPPGQAAFNHAIKKGHSVRQLFNTSGGQYRELGIKDKLDSMTQKQAVQMLSTNGYLCKRPIVIDRSGITVGFNEEKFEEVWG